MALSKCFRQFSGSKWHRHHTALSFSLVLDPETEAFRQHEDFWILLFKMWENKISFLCVVQHVWSQSPKTANVLKNSTKYTEKNCLHYTFKRLESFSSQFLRAIPLLTCSFPFGCLSNIIPPRFTSGLSTSAKVFSFLWFNETHHVRLQLQMDRNLLKCQHLYNTEALMSSELPFSPRSPLFITCGTCEIIS